MATTNAWAREVSGVATAGPIETTSALVEALESAYQGGGLTLIYVPVYFGPDELAGLGAFGRWNVGNWAEATQALRHEIGL